VLLTGIVPRVRIPSFARHPAAPLISAQFADMPFLIDTALARCTLADRTLVQLAEGLRRAP
jgi:hypothetical protein